MFLSHKIRIYPNKKQETYLVRAFGIKRLAYNWALAESKKLYEQGIKTNGYDLRKRFCAIKREQFPFVLEVSKWVPEKAIYDVYGAYKNWWKGISRRPRFKKKGKCRESFYIGVDGVRVKDNKLIIPHCTPIRLAQPLRFPGRVLSAVISKSNNRWYAAITLEIPDSEFIYPHACETQAVCGVDVGVRDLVVLSDGSKFPVPNRLQKLVKKLPRLQRGVSRKIPKSNRRRKAVKRLNNLFYKITNIRSDNIHKITSFLVENYEVIGIEDLDVEQMLKNKWYSKSISEACFGEIKRQLEYKTKLSGSVLVKADRFFPSSKTCSNCGADVDSLPLNVRTWICPLCDTEHDRDVNAAKNLKNVALRYRETENARGVESADGQDLLNVKLSTKKREFGNRQRETVAV